LPANLGSEILKTVKIRTLNTETSQKHFKK